MVTMNADDERHTFTRAEFARALGSALGDAHRIACYLDTSNDMEAYAARVNRWYARAPHVRAAYDRRRRTRRSGKR